MDEQKQRRLEELQSPCEWYPKPPSHILELAAAIPLLSTHRLLKCHGGVICQRATRTLRLAIQCRQWMTGGQNGQSSCMMNPQIGS
jgi:hypothetical protein